MTEVTAGLVKELREKTGAGMMDCKRALGESDGDIEAAVDWLRKKGLSAAAKKAGRVAAEGLIGIAIRGPVGAVVEVNSETDFVARNKLVDLVTTAGEGRTATDQQCARLCRRFRFHGRDCQPGQPSPCNPRKTSELLPRAT